MCLALHHSYLQPCATSSTETDYVAEDIAQHSKCLPEKHKDLGSIHSTACSADLKPGMVAHACNSSLRRLIEEAGTPQV